jgi:hypothetical protein
MRGWGEGDAGELTARRMASQVARHLGDGWNIRVWENVGWHASVQKGSISVTLRPLRNSMSDVERLLYPFNAEFSTLIGDPENPGTGYCFGAGVRRPSNFSGDPKESIRKALNNAIEANRPHHESLVSAHEVVQELQIEEAFAPFRPPPKVTVTGRVKSSGPNMQNFPRNAGSSAAEKGTALHNLLATYFGKRGS